MTLGQFGQRIEGIVGIDLLPDDRLEARHRFAAPRQDYALAFLYLVDDFLGVSRKSSIEIVFMAISLANED